MNCAAFSPLRLLSKAGAVLLALLPLAANATPPPPLMCPAQLTVRLSQFRAVQFDDTIAKYAEFSAGRAALKAAADSALTLKYDWVLHSRTEGPCQSSRSDSWCGVRCDYVNKACQETGSIEDCYVGIPALISVQETSDTQAFYLEAGFRTGGEFFSFRLPLRSFSKAGVVTDARSLPLPLVKWVVSDQCTDPFGGCATLTQQLGEVGSISFSTPNSFHE